MQKNAPLVRLEDFPKIRKNLGRVVLAGGSFDILHAGHILHLQEAKSLAETLIVHVATDKRITTKKGPGRPIFRERQRAFVISSVRFVDYVFISENRHYDPSVLEIIRPDILFFNQEAFTPQIKQNLTPFEGKIFVSCQPKLDSTSRAVEILKAL